MIRRTSQNEQTFLSKISNIATPWLIILIRAPPAYGFVIVMHILHYSAAAAASAGCGVQQSGGHRSTPAAAAAGEKQQQRRQGQSMRDMTYALVKERLKQTKSDVLIAVVVIIVIIMNKNQELQMPKTP